MTLLALRGLAAVVFFSSRVGGTDQLVPPKGAGLFGERGSAPKAERFTVQPQAEIAFADPPRERRSGLVQREFNRRAIRQGH